MVDDVSLKEIEEKLKGVQDAICQFLISTTGEVYIEDLWQHNEKGGGRTRVWEAKEETVLKNSDLNDGKLRYGNKLEKAGVNFSLVGGANLPSAALSQLKLPTSSSEAPYYATGVSLVLHPFNPQIPTIHMNVRYFEVIITQEVPDEANIGKTKTEEKKFWWFGGGIDLTPVYPKKQQVINFHKHMKTVCERNQQSYLEHKEACDKYFFLKHRGETRGIGGIFFDHLNTSSTQKTKRQLLDFIIDVGLSFNDLYRPFLVDNKDLAVTQEMREFQLFRRSRYVEFNLLYDRGTLFGLQSQGRVESILMSMPATAKWRYNWSPPAEPEGNPEKELVTYYLQPQNWVDMPDDQSATATTTLPVSSSCCPSLLPIAIPAIFLGLLMLFDRQ